MNFLISSAAASVTPKFIVGSAVVGVAASCVCDDISFSPPL
jgi:hypothetical protein